MAFAPLLVMGIAAAYQGIQKAQSDQYNAAVDKQQQSNAVDQSNAQANLVQRNSREMLGRQAAAFGSAGVGYGGSSEIALDQSAINQELDSLNTRYKGAVTGWGYGAQAQVDQAQVGQDNIAAILGAASAGTKSLAGTSALRGSGTNYTFGTVSPSSGATQAGLMAPGGSSGLA